MILGCIRLTDKAKEDGRVDNDHKDSGYKRSSTMAHPDRASLWSSNITEIDLQEYDQ